MLDVVVVDRIVEAPRLPDIVSTRIPDMVDASTCVSLMKSGVRTILRFRGSVLRRLQMRVGKKQAAKVFEGGDFWETLAGTHRLDNVTETIVDKSQRGGNVFPDDHFIGRSREVGWDNAEVEQHFVSALSVARMLGEPALDFVHRIPDADLRALVGLAARPRSLPPLRFRARLLRTVSDPASSR